MPNEQFLHHELTKEIIDTFYDVYNELGHGFLELGRRPEFKRLAFVNNRKSVEHREAPTDLFSSAVG